MPQYFVQKQSVLAQKKTTEHNGKGQALGRAVGNVAQSFHSGLVSSLSWKWSSPYFMPVCPSDVDIPVCRRKRISGKHQKYEDPFPGEAKPLQRIVMETRRLLVNTIIPLASPSLCVYCWTAPLAATLAAAERPCAFRKETCRVQVKTEWAMPETRLLSFMELIDSKHTPQSCVSTANAVLYLLQPVAINLLF